MLSTLLLLPLTAGYGLAAWDALRPVAHQPEPLRAFGIGLALYMLAWLLVGRRRDPGFWFVFRHEMAHAIFCVLMLRKVHSFQAGSRADAQGRVGMVRHDAARGPADVLIALAPYYFPTLTAALLLLRPLLQPVYLPGMDAVIGWSFGFHLVAFWRDVGMHQSDIRDHGRVFSTVFITLANLVITVSTILLLHGGAEAVTRFLVAGPVVVERMYTTYQPAVRHWLGT